jgi:replicative DNA helicase
MFIYRPEYYEVMNNEMGESTRGETHIRIAKHRNGSLETIKLRANLAIQRFHEWDDDDGTSGGGNNGSGGSTWKPLGPSTTPPNGAGGGQANDGGGKFFIQKGSRMNSGEFDDGLENDAPF